MRKAKEIAVVYYTTTVESKSVNVPYENLRELSQAIWSIIGQSKRYVLDKTTVTLPNGESYRWDECAAHYCFAKGRISEEQFVESQFSKENML